MCGKYSAIRCATWRQKSSLILLLAVIYSLTACRPLPDTLPQTIGRTEVENDPCMRQVVRAISERMTEIEMCPNSAYAFVRLSNNSSRKGWEYNIVAGIKANRCPMEYIDSLLIPFAGTSSLSSSCQSTPKSIILPLAIRDQEGGVYWTKQATRRYHRWARREEVIVWPVLTLYQSHTVFRR